MRIVLGKERRRSRGPSAEEARHGGRTGDTSCVGVNQDGEGLGMGFYMCVQAYGPLAPALVTIENPEDG